jgi:hypothetical protein
MCSSVYSMFPSQTVCHEENNLNFKVGLNTGFELFGLYMYIYSSTNKQTNKIITRQVHDN